MLDVLKLLANENQFEMIKLWNEDHYIMAGM